MFTYREQGHHTLGQTKLGHNDELFDKFVTVTFNCVEPENQKMMAPPLPNPQQNWKEKCWVKNRKYDESLASSFCFLFFFRKRNRGKYALYKLDLDHFTWNTPPSVV